MTELELALSIAFGVMLHLWIRQRSDIRNLRAVIFAVGEKKARIEISEEEKTVRIVPN